MEVGLVVLVGRLVLVGLGVGVARRVVAVAFGVDVLVGVGLGLAVWVGVGDRVAVGVCDASRPAKSGRGSPVRAGTAKTAAARPMMMSTMINARRRQGERFLAGSSQVGAG